MPELWMPTLAERPDLRAEVDSLDRLWPEFLLHDPVGLLAERQLRDDQRLFSDWQFAIFERGQPDVLLGRALTTPVPWPGDEPELPARGWDAALEATLDLARTAEAPVSFCALEIMLTPEARGMGLARPILTRLKETGRERGLRALLAPLRPAAKSACPELPMAEYVARKRPDGTHEDPWLRVHAGIGGEVLNVASLAMTVTGTYRQWREWTGTDFGAEPGPTALVPGGLAPVLLNHVERVAVYVEPNVWVRHRLR